MAWEQGEDGFGNGNRKTALVRHHHILKRQQVWAVPLFIMWPHPHIPTWSNPHPKNKKIHRDTPGGMSPGCNHKAPVSPVELHNHTHSHIHYTHTHTHTHTHTFVGVLRAGSLVKCVFGDLTEVSPALVLHTSTPHPPSSQRTTWHAGSSLSSVHSIQGCISLSLRHKHTCTRAQTPLPLGGVSPFLR